MIDELDLAFDEHDDRSRHRRRHAQAPVRKKKKKKKKRRGRTFLALFLTLVLFGMLGGLAYLGYDKLSGFFSTPDYDTVAGAPAVTVEIKEGATLTDIAKVLKENDVILSEQAFIDASNENSKAKNIQAGFYQIPTKLSGVDAVLALLNLENRVVNGVTIPEGYSTFKIYKLLSEKLGIPEKEFKAAAKDPIALGVPDWWFKGNEDRKITPRIEGFLFPDTYEFPPNTTAESALKMMVQRFISVTTEIDFVKKAETARNTTPYEALIVASLAQAESGTKKDLGKVARVAYNRIFKPKAGICNCLEMDVTVNYYYETQGKPTKTSAQMTSAELDNPKNPYNRKLAFLPSPINNPGKDALIGAVDTPKGDWYFFVAIDKEGNSAFAATNAEHEQNKVLACQRKIIC